MKPWIRRSLKRTLFGLFGATLLVGGLTACGHRGHEHGMASMSAEDQARLRDRMVERVSSKLDLNADQKQRLVVLADRLQEQRKALVGTTTPQIAADASGPAIEPHAVADVFTRSPATLP